MGLLHYILLVTTCTCIERPMLLVEECPSAENWNAQATKTCPDNPKNYHCLYTINCTKLVELCKDPQDGNPIYLYYYDDKEDKFFISDIEELLTNDTNLHELQRSLCQHDHKIIKSIDNDCGKSWFNEFLAFLILTIILIVIIVALCIYWRFKADCGKNTDKSNRSTDKQNKQVQSRFITQPTDSVSRRVRRSES